MLKQPNSAEAATGGSAISWLSSLALHLVAMNLFVWVLVPHGGSNQPPHVVEVSPYRAPEEPEALVVLAHEPPASVDSPDVPVPLTAPTQTLAIPDISGPAIQRVANLTLDKDVLGIGADYFGIPAAGDRFVYALDMSVSMNARSRHSAGGSRFDRACAELLRSVNALQPDQSFYVILFCHRTRNMFDERDEIPELVRATEQNKRRLRSWLSSIRTGSGTDPRMSIFRALQMQPSAIFLLSDGEFNGHHRMRGLGVNVTVEDIVQSDENDIPIHTIAYEDPISSARMERIATLSGGTFRFISSGFRNRKQ